MRVKLALLLAAAGLAVCAAPASARDYVHLVNPWVEADIGRYFFFQSASRPFGMVKLRPDTSTNAAWGTGYRKSEHMVKGFSHVHEWEFSGVQVMPTTGDVPKDKGDSGWESYTPHDDSEIAEPGYHRLHLDRYGITAELTSTERVGFHRYTYDKAGPSEIIVNLHGQLGEAAMEDAQVTQVSKRGLEGYVVEHGGRTKLYFAIAFSRPFDSLRTWGDVDGAFARFDHVRAHEQIEMKVALSLTGTEGAWRNLYAELPGWSFEKVKRDSLREWNEKLGRIDVRGGTPQQQSKFYTDLFHALCGRGLASDVDGRYLDDTWDHNTVKRIPLDRDGHPKFAMYNSDALWLTQWNLNTILGLAYPDIYSSFVSSMVQMYSDGGLLPRGPVAGDDSLIMTSSPVTSFIAGAYNKGIRDFDVDEAYDAMLDAHSVGGLFDKGAIEYSGWSGTGGIRDYIEHGYVPFDLGGGLNGGAGQTLEYANQDWALGELAHTLGKRGINASQFAHVSASSGAGERAVDGRPSRTGDVEWVSSESKPWIQLDWDQPRTLKRVVLSDRADANANANAGTLRFSDGSTVDVSGIPADGTPKAFSFAPRNVTSVRFEATGGSGSDVGLNELEAWDDSDVGSYLIDRSRNWRTLFDPSTGFIRPKGSDGKWLEPFDPLSPNDFVEANSWQAMWSSTQDVMGLANLLGGESAYAEKLNYAFERAKDVNFIGDYGHGFVSYGNQPGLEVAHLFNYVGYPWLTQHWVREVSRRTFGSTATDDGYGHHDEDQGQMGSLSALMKIGLFEVTGGALPHPVYDITSPVFDEVTIALDGDYYRGRRFKIVTHGNSAENQYIQRARLDGRPLERSWFRHDQFAAGGTLELWMGPQPNTHWGTKDLPPSQSPSEGNQPVYATSVTVSGPDEVQEPYGTAAYTAAFAPADTTLKAAYWSVTEPDGSPTGKATIDGDGVLKVNRRDGDVLVTATAADGGHVAGTKLVHLKLDVSLLRGNAARWPGVTAAASSEYSDGYPAEKVFDGLIGSADAGDWASKGEQNPWIELHWPAPVRADRIVLYDRPGIDDVHGGTLTFSDGSTVAVTGVPTDGSAKTVRFPMRSFDSVRFQVEGGTGPNEGLSELEVYAVPAAPEAPSGVTATAGAGSATVTWTAPRFDGGAPLTGYRITPYRDGVAQTPVTVDETAGTSATVRGLASGASYTFTVAASNLTGTGPESGPSPPITAG
jgi:putative alpha-1,2-mannosidase